jgi:hypothetical protein
MLEWIGEQLLSCACSKVGILFDDPDDLIVSVGPIALGARQVEPRGNAVSELESGCAWLCRNNDVAVKFGVH